MSKTYHKNDRYAPKPEHLQNQFSIQAYFERFDRILSEKKYNKNTDIKNIFHMLKEIQPHFGDTSFNFSYFIKLLDEIERLKKRCPVFTSEFDAFLTNDPTFMDAFIHHSFTNLDKLYKNKVFVFLLPLSHFPITFTHEQKECIYQALYIHFYSFDGTNFCDSLSIVAALKETPGIQWQHEWIKAFFEHKKEVAPDPVMLTYIADHLYLFDSTIACELTKALEPYKTPVENESEPITAIASYNINGSLLHERILGEKEKRVSRNAFSFVDTACIKQKNKIEQPKAMIARLTVLVHTTGEITEDQLNSFNTHIKKRFHDLSRKDIIQTLYLYALLRLDRDHVLPILKKAKSFFDSCKTLFEDIEESDFRKLIIAKRYFDLLGFSIDITHHGNIDGYLANLRKWVIKERIQSKTQTYAEQIIKLYLTDVEAESYIDVVCDCVDLFSPSLSLIIEVDGKSHTINDTNQNRITQLKTFLLKKHGFNLIRLRVERIQNEGRPYILSKIAPFISNELELLQNDYMQERYENGGKHSYAIIETTAH